MPLSLTLLVSDKLSSLKKEKVMIKSKSISNIYLREFMVEEIISNVCFPALVPLKSNKCKFFSPFNKSLITISSLLQFANVNWRRFYRQKKINM
jgi:hypothetical protein